MRSKRTLGVVLFEGFELLDVFGPLEMFGLAAEHFEIRLIAENGGVVASRQGPKSVCDDSFRSAPAIDVLLVPGGIATRGEVNNPVMLDWIKERSQQAELVASVCTGSALLALKPGYLMACAPPATNWPLPGRPLRARKCSGNSKRAG